jgi:putative ABC transport system permease protein
MFKLIWNRKKRNFLLISEIFFSFIVLFAVATMAISSAVQYFTPRGFDYQNVWVLRANWWGVTDRLANEEIRATVSELDRELRSYNEIEKISWSEFNTPYGTAIMGYAFEVNGRLVGTDIFQVDDDYAEVLNIPLVEGRWYGREDDASLQTPVVINRKLRETLFGDGPALGQVHATERREYKVVGVIDEFRYRGEFQQHREALFQRRVISDTTEDPPVMALLKVRPGIGVQFEEQLLKRVSAMAPGWSMRVETLTALRNSYLREHLMQFILYAVVAGFLVFNVALGLFGVLWYSINRRRAEVGLRRALGAHAGHISGQILGESLALATFALIAGVFIAMQAPIIGLGESISTGIYFIAMLAAAVLIYLLVVVCALYPSQLAARIQPAAALHNE